MRFNLPEPQVPLDSESQLRIGNVYKCKGGGKTKYWIVVGIDAKVVSLIGVNGDGVVTSATTYGVWIFDGSGSFSQRTCIGRVEGLEELSFDIMWSELP